MGPIIRRALLAMMIGFGGVVPAGAQDDYDSLPEGEGKEEVYGICSACHSIKLVTQQGMTRKKWDKTLDWMYEQQGMPRLEPEVETVILDYLAKHYGVESAQKDDGRPGAPSPFGSVRPLMPPQ